MASARVTPRRPPVVRRTARAALRPPDAVVTRPRGLRAALNVALRVGEPHCAPRRASRHERRRRRRIASRRLTLR